MLFSLKSYAKNSFTVYMLKLFFNQKLFYFFSQNVPFPGNTVDFLPYMVETVGGGGGGTAKHGEMRWTPKQ